VYRFSATEQSRSISASWPIGWITICELGAALGALTLMSVGSGESVGSIIVVFVILIAFLQFDNGLLANFMKSGPAQLLGRLSYSIYMVHIPILIAMSTVLKYALGVAPVVIGPDNPVPNLAVNPWGGDLLVAGTLITVLAVSYVTYSTIERPGRLYGRRVVGRWSRES
jgi:peptidoglycan/LPS O-acetylase OafA/YrhL